MAEGNIKLGRMTVSIFQTNSYFIFREGLGEVIIVDPGDSGDRIYEAMKANGFEIKAVLLTHGHYDHIYGVDALLKAAEADGKGNIKVYAYCEEEAMLHNTHDNLSKHYGKPCTVDPDVYLKDGDIINEAGMECKVIFTPGHTPGGCCFYFEEAGVLVSGDTLFADSVGRTDMPGGSMGTLVRAIRDKLFVLPDETRVFPGHGGTTTIGYEKENNPFCS